MPAASVGSGSRVCRAGVWGGCGASSSSLVRILSKSTGRNSGRGSILACCGLKWAKPERWARKFATSRSGRSAWFDGNRYCSPGFCSRTASANNCSSRSLRCSKAFRRSSRACRSSSVSAIASPYAAATVRVWFLEPSCFTNASICGRKRFSKAPAKRITKPWIRTIILRSTNSISKSSSAPP